MLSHLYHLRSVTVKNMTKDCSVAGCNHKAVSRGWCITHYTRWRTHGDVQAHIPIRAIGQQATCCSAKHYANGLCANHYMQKWRADHPAQIEIRDLRQGAQRAGLNPDKVEQHFRAHHGLCDICQRQAANASLRVTRLCIDHDHRTGQFRGLICVPCNRGIGFMDDSPERLEAAAAYLRGSHK